MECMDKKQVVDGCEIVRTAVLKEGGYAPVVRAVCPSSTGYLRKGEAILESAGLFDNADAATLAAKSAHVVGVSLAGDAVTPILA